jgi:hypothetical protein
MILSALNSSHRSFTHLTVLDLYSNPVISPASSTERFITQDLLLFIDDTDTIFPSHDADFHFFF